MPGRLEGKVTLVTGSGSGIGRAIVELAAREGARVVVSDANAEAGQEVADAIGQAGGESKFIACDVTDLGQVTQLVDAVVAEFGRLDCAVNNAGVRGVASLTEDIPEEEWDRVMAVDLKGVFLCMTRELAQMAAQGSGSIVNMSSTAGIVGWPTISAYSAAKFGVRGLTKAAALEYAAAGVRVNAICPGMTDTPMLTEVIGESRESEEFRGIAAQQPMDRVADPAETAEAVLWLLSDASSYATGTDLVLDGGTLAGALFS